VRLEIDMASAIDSGAVSKAALWTGWVLGGLPALFLLMDGAMKLAKPAFVVEGTTRLGYSEAVIVPGSCCSPPRSCT
jgi:hypothetical protein